MSNNFIVPNTQNKSKKQETGINESELHEVQEVSVEYIVTQSGTMHKDKFYIPKHLVNSFGDHYVWFRIIGEKERKSKIE